MKKNLLFCWFQRTPGKAEQGVLELSFSRTVWRVAGEETRLQLVREMKSKSGYSQTGISQRVTLQGQLWLENSCYLCVTVTQWKKDTLYASAKAVSTSLRPWFRTFLITAASTGVRAVYLFLRHFLISIILWPLVKIVEYQGPVCANTYIPSKYRINSLSLKWTK